MRNSSNKKTVIEQNYLERIPKKAQLLWSEDENGLITLSVENKGWVNRIAQKLFKRPKISYIHMDENGSFIWKQIDGKKDIISIGKEVKVKFGDKAEPLYERLSLFLRTMDEYNFIEWEYIPK